MRKLQFLSIIAGVVVIAVLFCGNKTTKYTLSMAKKNNDIIDVHGEITNMYKLEKFCDNINNGHADSIRITRYNSEGEAIIYDIDYDGEIINCSVDRRRDSTAKHTNRKITVYQFKKLYIRRDENVIEYFLTNTGTKDLSILVTANN